MIIKLVRHGESKANTREVDPQQVGDHTIPLSPLGRQQAQAETRHNADNERHGRENESDLDHGVNR